MQGVNTIYFKRNVDFSYGSDRDDDAIESRIAYFNSIKDAVETACPGWFNNIELEITTDSGYSRYNFYFIIDNIPLITISIRTGTYNQLTSIATSYNSGNNSFTFFKLGNNSGGSDDATHISAIHYSTNFCGIELSNPSGTNNKSTVIIFCKSNINNTVVIRPVSTISNNNTTYNSILTAYATEYRNSSTGFYIGANTVYSPAENTNLYNLDNYELSRSLCSNNDHVAATGIINEKFILTPTYIRGKADEYCPGVYYIKNSPLVLSTACNTILEVGKDFYFTNGIVAIKLT